MVQGMVDGLSGGQMLVALLIGIALLFWLVLFTKVHAFMALILTTVVIGVIGGVPVVPGEGQSAGIIKAITGGFGGTLGSIGIIIGFGVMMGQLFEVSGAAKRMALTFIRLFGKRREEEAMAITGFFVSIPIFCDSAFVVLAPLTRAISSMVKKSVIGLGVALAAGLVITHSMVPPTPGPLGVAGIFEIDVGLFLLVQLVLSLPMTIGCLWYAKTIIPKYFYRVPDGNGDLVEASAADYNPDAMKDFDESGLPSTLTAFGPLLLPILLILFNTIFSAMGYKTGFGAFMIALGQPIIAVGLGLLLAIATLTKGLDRDTAVREMEKGMTQAGLILLVTGGGGALGRIIADTGLGKYIAAYLVEANIPVLLLPLIISTAVRFIQGSGTVAMITAAGITAPIVTAAGASPLVGAIACCVGSLFFGYFNDSFFWVVNRMLGVSKAREQIRTWSVTTTIAWGIGVIEVLVLSMFL